MELAPAYVTSPTRRRRTRAEVEALSGLIRLVVEQDRPMTVRQVFYRLVSLGAIDKSETEYKATVCRLLSEMRLSGALPFAWIADNTRWMRKPRTYGGLSEALAMTARFYRRALWREMPAYVEVWLEKDALAGVLYDITEEWDVPLMVTRGYASLSYLHQAACSIRSEGKPAYLYYFGDYDPSGVDIPRNVEARLREFAPGAEIHFERVAVTGEQIGALGLPTRPTKKTDTRARSFTGESVEVDAIPPSQLKQLVRECIARHIDQDQFDTLLVAEESERQLLGALAREVRA